MVQQLQSGFVVQRRWRQLRVYAGPGPGQLLSESAVLTVRGGSPARAVTYWRRGRRAVLVAALPVAAGLVGGAVLGANAPVPPIAILLLLFGSAGLAQLWSP